MSLQYSVPNRVESSLVFGLIAYVQGVGSSLTLISLQLVFLLLPILVSHFFYFHYPLVDLRQELLFLTRHTPVAILTLVVFLLDLLLLLLPSLIVLLPTLYVKVRTWYIVCRFESRD